eukprot:317959_1
MSLSRGTFFKISVACWMGYSLLCFFAPSKFCSMYFTSQELVNKHVLSAWQWMGGLCFVFGLVTLKIGNTADEALQKAHLAYIAVWNVIAIYLAISNMEDFQTYSFYQLLAMHSVFFAGNVYYGCFQKSKPKDS